MSDLGKRDTGRPSLVGDNERLTPSPSPLSVWDQAKLAARSAAEFLWPSSLVQSLNRVDAKHPELQGHDPQKMLFVLADKDDPIHFDLHRFRKVGDYFEGMDQGAAREMGGKPTVYYLNSAKEGIHDPSVVSRTVEQHVAKYGSLQELRIEGHGGTNSIGKSARLNVPVFLLDLSMQQLQHRTKVADRIVFGGCDVFRDLTPGDVELYKRMARDLNASIVGAYTDVYGDSAGRFIEFNPDGTVRRDRLDSPGTYRFYSNIDTDNIFGKGGDSSNGGAWVENELRPSSTPNLTAHNPAGKLK